MKPNPHKYHYLPERERIKCDPRLAGFWALGADRVAEGQECMARIWRKDTTLSTRGKQNIEYPLHWLLTQKLEIDYELWGRHPELWLLTLKIMAGEAIGNLNQLTEALALVGYICEDDNSTQYFISSYGGYMQRDFLEFDTFYTREMQLRSVLLEDMQQFGSAHPMRNVLLFNVLSRKIEILTGSGYHGGAPVAYEYPNGWGKSALNLSREEQQVLVREAARFLDYALPVLFERFGQQTALRLLEDKPQGLFNFWLTRNKPQVASALESNFQRYDDGPQLAGINARTPLKRLPLIMLEHFGSECTAWDDIAHVCRGRSLRSLPSVQLVRHSQSVLISPKAAHIFGQMQGSGKRNYDRDLYTACCLAVWNNYYVAQALARYLEEHIGNGDYNNPIMKQLMLFFKRNENQLEGIRLGRLIDYLYSEYTQRPDFSLRGRTVHSMLRRMDAWHEELWQLDQISNQVEAWPKSGILSHSEQLNGLTFAFEEITTQSELIEEGRVMRHCVASYMDGCVEGLYAIWSLVKISDAGKERMLTIQVGRNRTIVQACGPHNHPPKKQERQLLIIWAKVAGLRLDYAGRNV